MKKVKIHPAFLALVAVLIGFGKLQELLYCIISVSVHEFFHYYMAKSKGYFFDSISIMPYGAVMKTDSDINSGDEKKIAIAGPVGSILLSVFTVALWWLYPSTYLYTKGLFDISLGIGVINLLPVYPMDGGRILSVVLREKKNRFVIMRTVSWAFVIILYILFIISAFLKINYTLGIMAIMVTVNMVTDTRNFEYIHICSGVARLKLLNEPLKKITLSAGTDVQLSKLFSLMSPDGIYTIEVVDSAYKPIAVLTEAQLEELLIKKGGRSSLGDLIIK